MAKRPPEPKIINAEDINPRHNWDRPIPALPLVGRANRSDWLGLSLRKTNRRLEPDDHRHETCIRAQRRHFRARRPALEAAVAFELQ